MWNNRSNVILNSPKGGGKNQCYIVILNASDSLSMNSAKKMYARVILNGVKNLTVIRSFVSLRMTAFFRSFVSLRMTAFFRSFVSLRMTAFFSSFVSLRMTAFFRSFVSLRMTAFVEFTLSLPNVLRMTAFVEFTLSLPNVLRMTAFFIFLISSFAIYSDETEVIGNYPQIRELLRQNNTSGAQKEISRLIAKNENDPTLSLYQTEVWIQIGERNYNGGNYKTAYEYFRRANNFWPNHPLVQMRYKELKKRNFKDVSLESNLKKSEIVEVKNPSELKDNGKRIIYVLDSGNNSDELKQILSEIKADLKLIGENKSALVLSENSERTFISKRVFWSVVGFLGMLIGGMGVVIFRMNGQEEKK